MENQKMAIREYCKRRRLRHVQWVAETISGIKKPEKRKLGKILNDAVAGDVIIVTEISRLGRSMIMILDTLQMLLEKDVKVYAIKECFELGDNIQSKVLAFAFGLSAEIERQLISERTKAGLARVRKAGKHIGRRKGMPPTKYKLSPKKRYIRRRRKDNASKAQIARECGVTWATLHRFMKKNKIK